MGNLGTQMMGGAIGFALVLCFGVFHPSGITFPLVAGEGVGAQVAVDHKEGVAFVSFQPISPCPVAADFGDALVAHDGVSAQEDKCRLRVGRGVKMPEGRTIRKSFQLRHHLRRLRYFLQTNDVGVLRLQIGKDAFLCVVTAAHPRSVVVNQREGVRLMVGVRIGTLERMIGQVVADAAPSKNQSDSGNPSPPRSEKERKEEQSHCAAQHDGERQTHQSGQLEIGRAHPGAQGREPQAQHRKRRSTGCHRGDGTRKDVAFGTLEKLIDAAKHRCEGGFYRRLLWSKSRRFSSSVREA